MSIYSLNKQRSILFLLVLLCILCIILEVSLVFNNGSSSSSQDVSFSSSKRLLKSKRFVIETKEILEVKAASIQSKPQRKSSHHSAKPQLISGLNFTAGITNSSFKSANDAVEMGRKLWRELESIDKNMSTDIHDHSSVEKVEECPYSVSVSGDEFSRKGKVILLPCGLTLGSHVTVIGKPRRAHKEMNSEKEDWMVSQFVLELQGLKTVQEGETPPTILHFNPRLEGDWSGNPVIEQNSCYRMQWGPSQRCEGWRSGPDEQTVDGFVKCEKWVRGYYDRSRWLYRLIQGKKKLKIDWAFPFSEDKLFVLTLSAGVEGYHAHVNGRPVTSFPYRTGFTLGDATGLSLKGDVDVVSIFAGSLPATHPSFAPQKHLNFSNRWKAPPIPSGRVELFIGILSAGNHFAERMAVRKSWMQHQLIKSSEVVARFFVALQERKEVNEEVRKEAEFFGDIVIVPYVDKYDLVVLKTVAICEYGVRTVSANYIMKGDDDTFVRVDAIIDAAKDVQEGRSLYIGNMNYYPEPLRSGKWAVTYEEWPEGVYPTYADGPGYIISSDIAHFILSDFEMHKLKLFKMEDVSMGMWVEKFNQTTAVEYVHSLEFCQFGCVENYITAHYQSPRQMICLWNKLRRREKPLCCDMR